MDWIDIEETGQYPEENETVWLLNAYTGHIWLGCYVYENNEGWFWAILDGAIYSKNGKIIVEAEIDDDYEITHWHKVPDLPTLKIRKNGKEI